jgi:multiple sugar transport system permease protein
MKVKQRRIGWLMLAPVLTLIVVINTGPILYSIALAFFRWNLTQANVPPRFVGLENFINLFTKDPQFLGALKHTFVLMFGVIVAETILGMILALLLNNNLMGTSFFTSLLLIPMSISPAIVGFLFQVLLNDNLGPINYFIKSLGLKAPQWLSDPSISLLSVGLVDIWQQTPFLVLLFLAGLRSLPVEPYEAATVDGASAWQRFTYLTLPLLKPVLFVAVLIRMMDLYKMFDLIYLLTFGGPGTSTQVLSFYGYKVGITQFRLGYASSISFVMVQLFIILVILYSRILKSEE